MGRNAATVHGLDQCGSANDRSVWSRLSPETGDYLPEDDNAEHGSGHKQGLTENRQLFSPFL
jgi:hypothetical protein